LDSYGISDTVVKKKDGTALYITQDIALTQLKKEAYQADRMVWVIGPEQSLAMQQLFAVCDQLGIISREQCEHLSYGFMSIKGKGKMSSRKGNTIFIDDLLDMARDSVRLRINNDALSDTEKDEVAELLAETAVKYAILKVGRTTDSQFDLETSISLEGDSGPYLQYTHARCQSILRQAGESVPVADLSEVALHPSEVALSRWLVRFPEVVAEAARQAAPNLIAQYLYELAQRFNAMYAQVSVLQADTPALRAHRIAEVASVAQVLRNGFKLLGFAAVDRM
jgi:arginyl-tRNA synthetase